MFQEHPRPRGQRLKPDKRDTTIDAAQLPGLLKRGATLPEIAEAYARQQAPGAHGSTARSDEVSKVLSSGLGLATGARTWWGCTWGNMGLTLLALCVSVGRRRSVRQFTLQLCTCKGGK